MAANVFPIDQLTDETKRGLLVALVRDLSHSGREPLRIVDAQGDLFIHSIPVDSRELAERAKNAATPEYRERLRRAAATPERSLGVRDFLMTVRDESVDEPARHEDSSNGSPPEAR